MYNGKDRDVILFKDDWYKDENRGAIVDITTKNKTFLRYAQLLKTMGVENNAFALTLLNPELQGVDPYDTELSREQQLMIAVECKLNPWYYFREVVRVPATGSPDNVPLMANRANMALYWLFFNHVTALIIQPRQTGKSVSTDCLMSNLLCCSAINTQISLLTKDDNLRTANVRRLKDIISGLPEYLNLRDKTDTNNLEKITVNALGNVYNTAVPRASIKDALNLGRGMTTAVNHLDEGPFLPNISYTLPAWLASSGAARTNARAHGSPYGNVFSTTAGYLNTASGEFFKKHIYNESLRWSEKLLDSKDEDDLVKTIEKNNPSGKSMVLLEFNHRQLGYTDDWLRRKIADSLADEVATKADFLNIWIEGSESSPLPKEVLSVIRASAATESYDEITTYGYIVRWYVPQEEVEDKCSTRSLVMALDTSDAIGNDDIAMIIRDAITGEVIAAGNYNETNLVVFAEWIARWLIDYPNIVLIPERRSSAVMLIDYLLQILPLKDVDPFKRIFNWIVDGYDVNSTSLKQILSTPLSRRDPSIYVKYKKEFGYATASSGRSARDNLYGTTFLAAAKYTGKYVRDKTLINQILGLIRKNNRIDHRDGEHDDMCFQADTLVLTSDGNRPIQDIKVGDLVLTRAGYQPVIATMHRQATVISRYGITGTPDHPFITPTGIVKFKDITDDTTLYAYYGKLLTISAKDIRPILPTLDTTPSIATVYNLTVANTHEYFVNNVLVHNCIAWLLSYWFLSTARNKEIYGINPHLALSSVNDALIEEAGGAAAVLHRDEQNKLKVEINALLDELKNETNIYKFNILQNKIYMLYDKVDTDTKNTFNIEELINKIVMKRKQANYYSYGRYY